MMRSLFAVMTVLFLGASLQGQSSDALLNKLVEKGILTTVEAEQLRKESDAGLTKALRNHSAMPDWVDSLKFSGDLRLRYDGILPDSSAIVDRHRARFRLRFGTVAMLTDDFEVGLRLASTVGTGGDQEGDPTSTNETFQNNGSRKPVGIDLAYVKWDPLDTGHLKGALVMGKMNNPFGFSEMVFDSDYTPEGLAQEFSITLDQDHKVNLAFGEFILDELRTSGRDPWMFVGEIRLEDKWASDLSSTLGLGGLAILHADQLTSSAVPNLGRGNTRDAGGALVEDYNVLILDGALTYSLDSFPLYPTNFPITLAAEYLHNFGANNGNDAYAFGPSFGKAGKKGGWEFSYKYKFLGRDAIYEELVDSDNVGYYLARPVGDPLSASFPAAYAGTNIRGHVFRLSYTPFDSLTLFATVWLNELIDAVPAGSESGGTRLIIDAVWKF